ncbi:carbon-nitrogen hydrolase family protein [Peptococcus simiae]|uniref:carbon-nitrogen hydrolase family protein n=1 Tax=Peptococcus simiae TaxID=1643805 RepID=UPI003981471A
MDKLQVALLQLPVVADKDENLTKAALGLREAAGKGARLVVLPEMWTTPYDTAVFADYAEGRTGKTATFLSNMARELEMVIVGGSIPEKDKAGRIYNTAFVFDAQGEPLAYHRKKHLFDIDIAGGQYFRESDVLTPGEESTTFETLGWTFGLGICFDVRFPDQALDMVRQGADCLIYPAAFNPSTGPLHWELLMRARAMDAQSWLLACAPARQTDGGYVSWAHSLVVNPWGTVEHDLGTDVQVRIASLYKESIETVRAQIPIRGIQA